MKGIAEEFYEMEPPFTMNEVAKMQSLPLEEKIKLSKHYLNEWITHYGEDKVYVSFSGGMGSTVLFFLTKEVCAGVHSCFVNTRNEYPETVSFVHSIKAATNPRFLKIVKNAIVDERAMAGGDTIDIRYPRKFQHEVVQNGYLVVSKQVSRQIQDCRGIMKRFPDTYLTHPDFLKHTNIKNRYSIPKKYQYLIYQEDLKVSNGCCYWLKHSVFEEYERSTGRLHPITGESASESRLRMNAFCMKGCTSYTATKPKCTPLAFWTEQDLMQYILKYQIPYATCYGDIIQDKEGKLVTTKEKRTGCMCCCAGACSEKGSENRYTRMQKEYPNNYRYCMSDLSRGGLGMQRVLKILHVKYQAKPEVPEDIKRFFMAC